MNMLSLWVKRLFYLCFIGFFVVLLCLRGTGLGLLLVATAIFIPYKFRIPHFLPILFVCSAIVHIVAVLAIQTPVISDFKTMYDAAQQVAVGDFSLQNTQYFFIWAYQTGFVLWEALLLKICNSMLFIKLVNALMLAGINCMIYVLARRFTSERAAQGASLLYLVTLFPTVLTCVLTNQHASAFFLVLALCVLTGGKQAFSIPRAVLAGILLALGNIMRPEAIVILAGLCGTAVFVLLMRRTCKGSWPMIRSIAIAAVLYAVCMAGASWAVSASGVNQYGLSNNWPQWKFILGFNQESGGTYSYDDANTFGWAHQIDTPDDIAAQAEADEKQVVLDRVFTSPKQLLTLMVRKAYTLWINPGLGFPLGYVNNTDVRIFGFLGIHIYEYCIQLDRSVFLAALLLALAGGVMLWRRKPEQQTYSAVLPPMIVMASAAVFLLIEVQPRYAFLPQIFLYITAAAGLAFLYKKKDETEQPPSALPHAAELADDETNEEI